jgi:hypothetical protein
MIKKYRTLKASTSMGHPVGTICYPFTGHDYGCAREDTRETGVAHVAMTYARGQ